MNKRISAIETRENEGEEIVNQRIQENSPEWKERKLTRDLVDPARQSPVQFQNTRDKEKVSQHPGEVGQAQRIRNQVFDFFPTETLES